MLIDYYLDNLGNDEMKGSENTFEKLTKSGKVLARTVRPASQV